MIFDLEYKNNFISYEAFLFFRLIYIGSDSFVRGDVSAAYKLLKKGADPSIRGT